MNFADVIFLVGVFEYSMMPDENFPFHDGGKVVFQRDWFIQKTSKFVLPKSSAKYGSYLLEFSGWIREDCVFEAVGKRTAEPRLPSLSDNCKRVLYF